jgi:hypothetical protein
MTLRDLSANFGSILKMNPGDSNWWRFLNACCLGMTGEVENLIASGFDLHAQFIHDIPDGSSPGSYGEEGLFQAAHNQKFYIARLLVQHGVDCTIHNHFPLQQACVAGDLPSAQLFYKHGGLPTPVHSKYFCLMACFHCHLHIVKWLMKVGVEPDRADTNHACALMINDYGDRAYWMIRHGFAVHEPNSEIITRERQRRFVGKWRVMVHRSRRQRLRLIGDYLIKDLALIVHQYL